MRIEYHELFHNFPPNVQMINAKFLYAREYNVIRKALRIKISA